MTVKQAELHVHLEGTISTALAHRLANRNKITLPDDLIKPSDPTTYYSKDFLHFLSVYDIVADLIKKPEDYYDVTFDYLEKSAQSGAIYIEMMYSPDHAELATKAPSIESLRAIQQAVFDAKDRHEIVGRVLITAVRHFGAEKAVNVAKAAAEERVPCVVGFGLGGDEFNYPPHLFQEAYQIAHNSGLKCTVHAGEFHSWEGVQEAMMALPIERIGHGVRSIESEETIAMLQQKNIALEICPTSNIRLGLYPDMASHPLPQLLEAGLDISLNSDDPPFFGTTLANEYEKVQSAYAFTDQQMLDFTRMAITRSFAEKETKEALLKQL